MLTLVESQVTVAPIVQRFLGCILLGNIPPEVAEAVDNLEENQIPESTLFLFKIWWGRNRAEEALPDVIELLQDTVKEMLT